MPNMQNPWCKHNKTQTNQRKKNRRRQIFFNHKTSLILPNSNVCLKNRSIYCLIFVLSNRWVEFFFLNELNKTYENEMMKLKEENNKKKMYR